MAYSVESVKVIEEKYGNLLKEHDDENILDDILKKLSIFSKTLEKMKLSFEKLR